MDFVGLAGGNGMSFALVCRLQDDENATDAADRVEYERHDSSRDADVVKSAFASSRARK
jgi:hypothetical protein